MFNNLKKFYGGVEIGTNAYIKNATVESINSDPSSIVSEGRIWYNNTDNIFKASYIDTENDKIINYTFHTKEEFNKFVALLASQIEGEGSKLVGFSGRDGAYAKFSIPANDVESVLKSLVDGIDADRKTIETNKDLAKDAIDAVQNELDVTQTGAGLNDDGTYSAISDANYIQNAESLLDADKILDASLKAQADQESQDVQDINNRIDNLSDTLSSDFLNKNATDAQSVAGEVTFNNDIYINGELKVNQGKVTEIFTEQMKIADNIFTLNSDVPDGSTPTENAGLEINRGAEGIMPFLIWDEENDVAKVVTGKDGDGNYVLDVIATGGNTLDIQEKVDKIEAGAGLNEDGTYTSDSDAAYIKSATTLYQADQLLDAQVKTNTDNLTSEIDRATKKEDDIQTELDATQTGAGLNEDGTYTAPSGRAYISDATSLLDADIKLDNATKVNEDNLNNEIQRAKDAEASIQKELDAAELGAGLNDDGTYTADTDANYIKSAESLFNADQILDSTVKAQADKLNQEIQDRIDADTNIKTSIDNAKIIFDASDAAASYTISHNFGTFNVVVNVWIYDDANNVYYNDDVKITLTDNNTAKVELSTEAKVKVIIQNCDKLFS